MATIESVNENTAERRVEIEALLLCGWTQRAIARKLGLSPHVVRRDVQALRAEWKQSRVRDYESALSQELEKLERVEREAWEAWERSKLDEERTKVSQEDGGKKEGGKERAEKATTSQTGDLRYLELVVKCVERRCKMQGLDDPLEHLVRDTYCVAARELNDDELRALSKLRQRLCNDEAQNN